MYSHTLFKTEFLSLLQSPDGYFYVSEHKSLDRKIAVLGFLGDKFLVRSEVIPPWGPGHHMSSLTGSGESGVPIKELTVREIQEESGWIVQPSDLIELGECQIYKAAAAKYFLFAVDLDGKLHGPDNPDPREQLSHCAFATADALISAPDPLLAILLLRLINVRRQNGSIRG